MPSVHRGPVAEIRPCGHVPALFINGDAATGLAYVGDVPELVRDFVRAGVRVFSFCTRDFYDFLPGCPEHEKTGMRGHEESVRGILRECPDAWIFPRLQMESPNWWNSLHPGDVNLHQTLDGSLEAVSDGGRNGSPSWASGRWREDMAGAIRAYIDAIQESEHAGRIIGYHLASGTSAEWQAFGSIHQKLIDYSPAGVRAFRDWLRKRYPSESALREAWQDPQATFETAPVPTARERLRFDGEWLLDPSQHRPVIDYRLFFSDLTVETIEYFASRVKERTQGKAMVGVFYGYLLQHANDQRQQSGGHSAVRKLLDLPCVDFVSSPSEGACRELATGYSTFMTPVNSVILHGKLWYNENDYRSPLVDGVSRDSGAKDPFEYAEVQKRELAGVLRSGVTQWWLDFNGGWHRHPHLLDALQRVNRIQEEALGWPDRTSIAEVAVILDGESQVVQPVANQLPVVKRDSANRFVVYDQVRALGHMGAAFDWYVLDDLDRMREYRLYIFLNAYLLDDRKRELIRRSTRRPGVTALFLYGTGAVADRLDPDRMEEVTGIRTRMDRKPGPCRVYLEKGNHPLLGQGMQGVPCLGGEYEMAPRFVLDDPETKVLGRYGSGEPALGVKELPGGGTSVYVGSPICLDSRFWTELARYAGAHIYTESGDGLYVGNGFLGIHTATGGPKSFRLPAPSRVHDLWEDRTVYERTTVIELDQPAGRTMLYRLGPLGNR